MVKTKLKKGDTVIVIAGKEKGKIGKIKQILRDENPNKIRVIVEGVNVGKKHVKHIEGIREGGIFEIERPIHISNVAYYDESKGEKVKIGIRIREEGNKVIKERYNKKTGETIDIIYEKEKK
ncbi:MAG TPA: 50S ribosomal protein L24 [Persephonella sp.]|uniref:Large ribosomal subunit protein uL24 n=1 Tax=Persephonella marina (strain DSM 14350 / EX-H1) TaxID=123214 RepID=C0QQN4_PERMH|nr:MULTISPECIES: 50S ribosomal protein L24 [Persephonella]ACO04124.1 ribosomal protein L24 [Persephonella marina EX-H1]HCB68731.1 50S ribosomal protein L24 [Persephonella sp.]